MERIDGRVLIGVIGVLLLAAAAYEYSLVQGLAPAARGSGISLLGCRHS